MKTTESHVHTSRIAIQATIKRTVLALNRDYPKSWGLNREHLDGRALSSLVEQLQAMEKAKGESARLEILESINHFFKRYTVTPSLGWFQPSNLPGSNTSKPKNQPWTLQWHKPGKMPKGHIEFTYVTEILTIAQAGHLTSIRQCEQCHKWMFARFSHQRFCNDSCRELFHRFNPDDKKRRANWKRENYSSK